eukprot:gene17168-23484_t
MNLKTLNMIPKSLSKCTLKTEEIMDTTGLAHTQLLHYMEDIVAVLLAWDVAAQPWMPHFGAWEASPLLNICLAWLRIGAALEELLHLRAELMPVVTESCM